jgi:hypothetical protein
MEFHWNQSSNVLIRPLDKMAFQINWMERKLHMAIHINAIHKVSSESVKSLGRYNVKVNLANG